MVLPLALGVLGSGLAGAGALGALSPLIAGALGTGIGSAVQEGSLEEGIKSGLGALALGGIGGALTGGLSGAAAPAAQGLTQGATQGATQGLTQAGGQALGTISGQTMPSAVQTAQTAAQGLGGGAAGAAQGKGLFGMLKNMPSGMSAVAPPAGGVMEGGLNAAMQRGLRQGVMTGGGLGTATYGAMDAMKPPTMDTPKQGPGAPEPGAAERRPMRPGPSYRPGVDPEPMYFSPSIYTAGDIAKLAGGGRVEYRPTGMGPIYMAAGGLADMAGAAGMPVQPMPEMNEKELMQMAIRAVRNELPEEAAAIVLGQFLQKFGEDALRKLVDDVQTGRADGPRGDVEGMVRGPGDGMDDMVPAAMDDGSQDVLLSNDEFIVPADVVSGLGNGSSEAGARELHGMMDRVREARTGKKEQPKQVNMGGLMPA